MTGISRGSFIFAEVRAKVVVRLSFNLRVSLFPTTVFEGRFLPKVHALTEQMMTVDV